MMSTIAWGLAILFSALLFWAVIRAAARRFRTIDETTLSVFKLMLRHRGLDPSLFPDAALIDIVIAKIEQAKTKAALAQSVSPDDWQRYLFRLLEEEAGLMKRVIRDGAEKHAGCKTAGVLVDYGVVRPNEPPSLSVEQFIEASQRGTLFAELDKRISRRDVS